jgi:pimeloyl-ACP methyl ester carboxylesterase
VTPIAEAMSLRSLLKGELVIVPNVGHLPNVEDPLAFNEALVRFLTA